MQKVVLHINSAYKKAVDEVFSIVTGVQKRNCLIL